MVDKVVSRRGFLAAGAGGAVLLASAGGLTGAAQAFAASGSENAPEADEKAITTLCAGCGNKCGLTAYVSDGKIKRVAGLKTHPYTGGVLCGRGQGFPWTAYADTRVQTPLKADGKGGFQSVSWDEALNDIASRMKDAGAEKTAWFQEGRGMDKYYTQRLMAAFGSANFYDESALNDVDISTVIMPVLGAFPAPSAAEANCIVLLDKSAYEGVRPNEVAEIAKARARGAQVYVVDPRLASVGSMGSEWVPVKAGTELAFLLGISAYLVQNKLYDQEFVAKNGHGFDAYEQELAKYSIAWTNEKTGIPTIKLEEIAHALADAAPQCYVDLQWAGTLGSGYANSAEQIRALLLLNALLGNFNQPGGLVFAKAPYLAPDALDATVFVSTPKVTAKPVGEGNFALSHATSCQAGLRSELKAAVFCECDPATDWPDTAGTKQALDAIPFKVVLATTMTPTAKMADYVLPALSYLERPGIVDTATAVSSVATLRNKVIEPVVSDGKAVYEIVVDLAGALGLKQYFSFSLDAYNEALCAAYQVKYDDLKRESVAVMPNCTLTYGEMPFMMSASHQVEFTCEAFAAAGRTAVPTWIEPAVQPSEHNPRLITGDQFTQVRSYTLDSMPLREEAKAAGLDRVWINTELAKKENIANGDRVKIISDTGETVATALVTAKIHPEAVYLPPHYGRKDQGFGASLQNLVPCQYEPNTGAAMTNEVLVTLQKEGA